MVKAGSYVLEEAIPIGSAHSLSVESTAYTDNLPAAWELSTIEQNHV